MTNAQTIMVLAELHSCTASQRDNKLDNLLSTLGIDDNTIHSQKAGINKLFNEGIKNINEKQLKNLIEQSQEGFNEDGIIRKLEWYGVDKEFNNNILDFLKMCHSSRTPIQVESIDASFKGVQVATRDSFHKIINDGYTGDWIVNPYNIKPYRIQIASMNEDGPFPRGWYINADIEHTEEVYWGTQKRYRIFIKNPVVINSGNPNVKFNNNPVCYI